MYKNILKSRINRLERYIAKNESIVNNKNNDAEYEASVAIANWVRQMWKADPNFAMDAKAFVNGDSEGDWLIDACLDSLDNQGFSYDNDGADYISDCLADKIIGILEAAESCSHRRKSHRRSHR
jgi:hypothetical protein